MTLLCSIFSVDIGYDMSILRMCVCMPVSLFLVLM